MSATDPRRLPIAAPSEVRRVVVRLFAQEKGIVALVCILYLAAAAASAAMPAILGGVIDGMGSDWDSTRVDLVCATLFGCVAAQMVLVRFGRRLGHRFGDRSSARIRETALDRVLRLPLGVVERAGTGDLATRTTGDVAAVADLLRYTGPEVVGAVIELLVLVVAALLIDPLLALFMAVVLPPLALAARTYIRQARPAFLAERAAMSELAEALTASANGARTVAAHLLQPRRAAIGHRLADAHHQQLRGIVRIQTWFLPTLDLAYTLPVSALLVGGGLSALGGGVSVGAVVACTMLAYRLSGPLDRIMYSLTEFQSAAAALARVEGIGCVEPEARTTRTEASDVDLDRVRFGYGNGPDILSDFDLRVRPGERLAVVGPSGAGKSSVARLIAGIERPRSGTVSVGGVPSADIELEDLRRKVILVTQEHYVFNASLRDNLALAAETADDVALSAALARVGATWAADLPNGLDTMLGDEHLRLTLAQAQQIALGRVILADPDVVILDEATTGLDSDSVGKVEAALTAALAGRTVITVAHQLQATEGADRIAVVENGRVTEIGTHAELLSRRGSFAELWEAWNTGRPSG